MNREAELIEQTTQAYMDFFLTFAQADNKNLKTRKTALPQIDLMIQNIPNGLSEENKAACLLILQTGKRDIARNLEK